MKQFILKHKKTITGSLAILLVGAVTMSFQDSPFTHNRFTVQNEYLQSAGCADTLPQQKRTEIKDFSKLEAELDKALSTVNTELNRMDFSKMKQDIENALKDVDMQKIRAEVDLALKNIDLDKLQAGIKSSHRDLNLTYNEAEIERAFAEVKKEIAKVKIELKDIDRSLIKNELEKARLEIDKIDLDKIKAEVSAEVNKAKTELKQTREMLKEMENDGLINLKKGFNIEYKNKDLFIDGVKQPEQVADKYRKYFNKEHFTLKVDKD